MTKKIDLSKNNKTLPTKLDEQIDSWVSKGKIELTNETNLDNVEEANTGSPVKIKNITIRIPSELHIKLKFHCFKNEIKINDFVTKLLKQNL